jgi:photosystem II stability/assembly factor-like uncharacterized protein
MKYTQEFKPSPSVNIIYALAASPSFAVDGICFAGHNNGLSRSIDGGETWVNAYHSLELTDPLPTMAIALSPDFISDRTVFAGVMGGVLYSQDGGETWQVSFLREPRPLVSALGISPSYSSDGTSFAATVEDGVYISNDRGMSFIPWNFGLLDFNIYSLAISPNYDQDGILFVGCESGIFRSKNRGKSWREVNFPVELAPVLTLFVSPSYSSDGMLIAGTESKGVFRSTDDGLTWLRVCEDIGDDDNPVNLIVSNGDWQEGKKEVLVVGGDALFISRDGGVNWRQVGLNISLKQEGITTCFAPSGLGIGTTLFVGLTNGEIHKIRLSN